MEGTLEQLYIIKEQQRAPTEPYTTVKSHETRHMKHMKHINHGWDVTTNH